MTAEVAILNKHAVALAADSAVTTGDLKIFNTVSKLFGLSKTEPVGIMAYNAAEVMGVPIETVIKEFRRDRGDRSWPHLEDYATEFEEYLRDDTALFAGDARQESLDALVWELAGRIRAGAHERLESLWGQWGRPTEQDARDALDTTVHQIGARIKSARPLAGINLSAQRPLIAAAVNDSLRGALDWIGDALPLDAGRRTRIRRLIVDHFARDVDLGAHTGFVIAGFGNSDVFPRLRAFEICCSSPEVHKIRSPVAHDISHNNLAAIVPFAQNDVMITFMEGKDRVYDRATLGIVKAFFEEKKNTLLAAKPPKKSDALLLDQTCDELTRAVIDGVGRVVQRRFVNETMQVVASMPKEELATLAEALINLTALKRKASRDQETVGGPTDVAVISKGDGFVWIKRRHYFDPILNPGWQARYMRCGNG